MTNKVRYLTLAALVMGGSALAMGPEMIVDNKVINNTVPKIPIEPSVLVIEDGLIVERSHNKPSGLGDFEKNDSMQSDSMNNVETPVDKVVQNGVPVEVVVDQVPEQKMNEQLMNKLNEQKMNDKMLMDNDEEDDMDDDLMLTPLTSEEKAALQKMEQDMKMEQQEQEKIEKQNKTLSLFEEEEVAD